MTVAVTIVITLNRTLHMVSESMKRYAMLRHAESGRRNSRGISVVDEAIVARGETSGVLMAVERGEAQQRAVRTIVLDGAEGIHLGGLADASSFRGVGLELSVERVGGEFHHEA